VSLVQPTVKSGLRGFIQNLFCKFWTFLQVSTNFGSLKHFLRIKINWKRLKRPHSIVLHIRLTACGARGLEAHLARWAESAPGSAATTTVAQPAHADAARGRAVTAHGTNAVARPPASSRGTRCGGTGGVSSSRRRGRRRAQPRGRTLTGWTARRRGGKKKVGATALLDDEGAPGTLTAPGVALRFREGNERVRPAQI
jgi:hypothetical protein